jgi:hypothetical protein
MSTASPVREFAFKARALPLAVRLGRTRRIPGRSKKLLQTIGSVLPVAATQAGPGRGMVHFVTDRVRNPARAAPVLLPLKNGVNASRISLKLPHR